MTKRRLLFFSSQTHFQRKFFPLSCHVSSNPLHSTDKFFFVPLTLKLLSSLLFSSLLYSSLLYSITVYIYIYSISHKQKTTQVPRHQLEEKKDTRTVQLPKSLKKRRKPFINASVVGRTDAFRWYRYVNNIKKNFKLIIDDIS